MTLLKHVTSRGLSDFQRIELIDLHPLDIIESPQYFYKIIHMGSFECEYVIYDKLKFFYPPKNGRLDVGLDVDGELVKTPRSELLRLFHYSVVNYCLKPKLHGTTPIYGVFVSSTNKQKNKKEGLKNE